MAKPPAKKLSPDLIVDEALKLIEEEGAAALSARRLAGRVGCEAMSLYHHVGSMDELIDRIVERLLESHPTTADLSAPATIGEAARSYLQLAADYPNAFPLIANRRWRRPGARARGLALVAMFEKAKVADPWGKARVLGAYLNGAGLALAACRNDPDLSPEELATVTRQLEEGMTLLIPGERPVDN